MGVHDVDLRTTTFDDPNHSNRGSPFTSLEGLESSILLLLLHSVLWEEF